MVCLRHARNLLGKIQKEKSKPTPEPEKSEKELPKEVEETIPDVEKPETETPEPKAEPQMSDAEKVIKDKKLNKLFWMRVALGCYCRYCCNIHL